MYFIALYLIATHDYSIVSETLCPIKLLLYLSYCYINIEKVKG
jgi:hypothetical protein